jgi:hypothetical protein
VFHSGRVLSASPSTETSRRLLTACLALLLGVGCSDDAVVIPAPGGVAPNVDNPMDVVSLTPIESSPALLVAVIVQGPEDRNVYVGAVPEVPTGELDYSRFLEFGSVDVYTSGGYVFVWDREPARMTRFSVNEDLSLSEGPTVSFERYGAAGGGENVFVSATRSYLLSPQLDAIIVWNPESMEITGTIEIALPGPPGGTGGPTLSGNETFAHKGQLVGDNVIWQVVTVNWESNVIDHAATLAVASATTDEPVRVIEDSRCAGANGGHVDERGDYYVRADGYWGFFAAYGDSADSVRTCVLKVPAGTVEFDPSYLVDLGELTGTTINYPWFHVEGSQYLAQVWDSAQTIPDDPNQYWYADMKPLLVDVARGTAAPYSDIDGSIMVASAEYSIDGVSYYELNPQGYVVGGRSDIVELRPEGIVRKFNVPGLWAFARIR